MAFASKLLRKRQQLPCNFLPHFDALLRMTRASSNATTSAQFREDQCHVASNLDAHCCYAGPLSLLHECYSCLCHVECLLQFVTGLRDFTLHVQSVALLIEGDRKR